MDPFVIKEQKTQIKRRYRNLEWSLEPEEERRFFMHHFLEHKRIKLLFFVIITGLLMLLGRTIQLQLFQGERYLKAAEGNRLRTEVISAERGIIYDKEGRVLVKNSPLFNLYLIPSDLPRDPFLREEIIKQNALQTGLSAEEIKEKLAQNQSEEKIIVASNLDYEQAIKLLADEKNLPGFEIEVLTKRDYLYPESGAHVLGYLGRISPEELSRRSNYTLNDVIGKTGIESVYEEYLKGKAGARRVEITPLGYKKETIDLSPAESGQAVHLTIDAKLQERAYQTLKSAMRRTGATGGVVVAVNPKNGAVLSLVSLPDFNPNLFSFSGEEAAKILTDPGHPLFNRAVSGAYPPGSTIKPIIAAAALEEGVITPKTSFLSSGGIGVKEWFFPDWKAGGHGWTNVRKAIAESVNTFFYLIGGGLPDRDSDYLGVAKIKKYTQLFGLNQKLGIDLPGEEEGFLPSKEWKEEAKKERWYVGDTYHLAIGQGDVLVTPLQIAMATSVFANGGTLFQPRILEKIENIQNEVIYKSESRVIRKDFIKQEYLSVVREGLRDAVIYGSARALNILPIKAAGKTGTAQSASHRQPHAWFTGFAPYDDPEIAVTVLLEGGGEGSVAAVPVAKEIFLFWAKNKRMNN